MKHCFFDKLQTTKNTIVPFNALVMWADGQSFHALAPLPQGEFAIKAPYSVKLAKTVLNTLIPGTDTMNTTPTASNKKTANPIAVLNRAASKAKLTAAELEAVKSWLGEQFLANMYAKLGQVGEHEGDVALRRVFVDLPVLHESIGLLWGELRGDFLASFLKAKPIKPAAITKLPKFSGKRSAIEQDEQISLPQYGGRQPRNDRFSATLLIGGPGQGKSTLGQLACQLHRAALLQPFAAALSTRHQELLASFYAKSEDRDGKRSTLLPPAVPFLPLQISLPDLAAWLAKKTVPAQQASSSDKAAISPTAHSLPQILQFLAERPSAQTCKLDAGTLLSLAMHMPVLLVLDGFDEVGAGKDRERLVHAARELLTILTQQATPFQVLATTRPQGYAGELAHIGVRLYPYQLAVLEKDEALHYAAKLVHAQIPGADARHQILARLEDAANEPATQRLLTTPLQVTILASLVQQSGRAPRERWNLFEKYFSYTYNREIIHNTYASNLLSAHRHHIIKIHARVALLLQVESERDGGAAARMPQHRLEEVIDAVLLEDGIADDERITLVREITIAAGQRLVFLVEPEPGSFGFEIRSLQEFMAAWALTSGRENELEARLRAVTNAPMFRNVTLFIASRFFSEGSPLRDVFADSICPGINHDPTDELARQSYAGSLLALEILEEGAVLMQPNRARALMLCACDLLNLPPGEEHFRLVAITNKDTYPVLHQALEQNLAQGSGPLQQLTGWYCLLFAVNRDRDNAVALAERYWTQLAGPAFLWQKLRQYGMGIWPWLSDKMAQNPHHFSPIDFIAAICYGDNRVAWLWQIFANWYRKPIRANWTGASVAPLNEVRPTALDNEVETEALPPCWQAWIEVARFWVTPDANKLAKALFAIAKYLPEVEWKWLQDRAAWPLAVCLCTANNSKDLIEFAQKAQSGVLGDVADWLAAEREWDGQFTWPDNSAELGQLWTRESLKHQLPLLVLQEPSWFSNTGFGDEFFAMTDRILHANGAHRLRNWLLDVCRIFIVRVEISQQQFESYLHKWVSQSLPIGRLLIPRPEFLPHQTWLKMIDVADGVDLPSGIYSWGELLPALHESEGHPKVLKLVFNHISHLSGRGHIGEADREKIRHIVQPFQKPGSASSDTYWRILNLFVGFSVAEQDDILFDGIAKLAKTVPVIWRNFIAILGTADISPPRMAALLSKVWANPGARQLIAAETIDLMRKQLQSRQSGLDNHTTWNRLALRLPYPLQTPSQFQQAALPSTPVHIASLELKNIRALQHLKLDFPISPENHGQWIVILGPNGVGKTTLLRSLALALRNTANQAIWPKGVFSNNWLRTTDNKETKIGSAEIVVTLASAECHTTTITQNGSTSTKQHPEQERTRLFPVFGYGCRRGSALSGESREVRLNDSDGPEISTLFDDDADLMHAETWFRMLESDAQKDQQYRAIFDAVKAALIKFLDLTEIEIKVGGGVWVTEKTGLKLPLKDLSDGYLTSAGWFLDMIARWIELARQNEVLIDGDFMTQMRGLVLIDEIDLHLHPRWQIEIIDRTRKLLPQMSFIVTTHNPLTLVGAKAHEIWILARENGRIQAKIQGDTPMLLTGGQIYRRFFGIEDIYPNGLGAALQRYSFLSGYPLRTDDEQAELTDLQNKLAQADILPDWEVVPRETLPQLAASEPADALPDVNASPGAEPAKPATRKPRGRKARAAT
jgi:AAA domain, putative AbiEii toxin, Type IV TA system